CFLPSRRHGHLLSPLSSFSLSLCSFFDPPTPTAIYPLSLHDALPICPRSGRTHGTSAPREPSPASSRSAGLPAECPPIAARACAPSDASRSRSCWSRLAARWRDGTPPSLHVRRTPVLHRTDLPHRPARL